MCDQHQNYYFTCFVLNLQNTVFFLYYSASQFSLDTFQLIDSLMCLTAPVPNSPGLEQCFSISALLAFWTDNALLCGAALVTG